MTDKEFIEGNKLIALSPFNPNVDSKLDKAFLEKRPDKYFLERLCYHQNWDLLMPVVEKIESTGYKFQICRRRVEINKDGDFPPHPWILSKEDTKMQSVYNACIQFAKWYNSLPLSEQIKEETTGKKEK